MVVQQCVAYFLSPCEFSIFTALTESWYLWIMVGKGVGHNFSNSLSLICDLAWDLS